MMATRKLLVATMLVAAATIAVAPGATGEARADGPQAFGPVESRSFAWKPGTAIEKPTGDCSSNADWLLIRGPNVATAKTLDITPHTAAPWERQSPFTGTCLAPDCVQIFVKIMGKDAPGTSTVTLKHADGRTTTTTFDVKPNAGRCDYPKGKAP